MTLDIASEPVPLTVDGQGVVLIGNTRVTIDTVVAAFSEGATAEEIVQQYPSLDLADVYSVVGYYLKHKSEVDTYLEGRRRRAATVQEHNEARNEPAGIRDRLLARRMKKE